MNKEILTTYLDGITLTMIANYDLNVARREGMKPNFKPGFAKGLCSSSSPADEYLIGCDTAKRIKEINALNKQKVRLDKSSVAYRGRRKRYSPYSQRGPKGRGFRGCGSLGGSFYRSSSQRQNFPNMPQSQKETNLQTIGMLN